MTREEILIEAVSRLSVFRYWREEMTTQMIRVFSQLAQGSEAKQRLYRLVDHMTMTHNEWPGPAAFVSAYRLLYGETAHEAELRVLHEQAEEQRRIEEAQRPARLEVVPAPVPPAVTVEMVRRRAFRLRMVRPETVGDPEWEDFECEDVERMQEILDRIAKRGAEKREVVEAEQREKLRSRRSA